MVKWILGFIVMIQVCFGQILQNRRQHELLLNGIHQTLNQQYDSAETTFRKMIEEFPQHPSGYLYLAGMFQAKYTDYGDRFNEKQYDSLLSVAGLKAETMIENKNDAAWGYFYSGMSDAFRSYTASENGSLPTGFYYGMSAGNALEKCLELDSNFTEAKNILGSYYFWRSKLAWLPFVSDRTEEGIHLIQESFSHPYEKHLASHNLMVIFIDEKRFEEAEYYGLQMLKEYPANRSYLWNMMTLYEQWGKADSINAIVERLLYSTLTAPTVNRYTEATCRLKIAQYALRQNDSQTAKSECEKILVLEKYVGKTKGDLKKKIRQAKELMERVSG